MKIFIFNHLNGFRNYGIIPSDEIIEFRVSLQVFWDLKEENFFNSIFSNSIIVLVIVNKLWLHINT